MTSAISDLLAALNLGFGINTGALVRDLGDAARAPRTEVLARAGNRNRAQVGAIAATVSALGTFADALKSLFDGPGFYGTLASSDEGAVGVALSAGVRPPAAPVSVVVDQLASATVMHGAALPIDWTADGGSLDLTVGTGAANAVTLAAGADAGPAPASLASGMTMTRTAADALVRVDDTPLRYPTNTIEGAVPGVRLTLSSEGPAPVEVRAEAPAQTMRQLMNEFVTAFNTLRQAPGDATAAGADGAPGRPAAGDPAARELMRALGRLPLTPLVEGDPQATMNALGIATGRDGSLTLDTAKLDKALATDPDRVRAWLDPDRGDSTAGIAAALSAVRDRFTKPGGLLTVAADRYAADTKRLRTARERLDRDDELYRAQLQRGFGMMDVQLTRPKQVQSYVTQQVAMWTASRE